MTYFLRLQPFPPCTHLKYIFFNLVFLTSGHSLVLLLPVLSHRPDHLVGDRAGESVLLGEGEGRHPQGQLDADDDGEADGEGQQGAVVLLYERPGIGGGN